MAVGRNQPVAGNLTPTQRLTSLCRQMGHQRDLTIIEHAISVPQGLQRLNTEELFWSHHFQTARTLAIWGFPPPVVGAGLVRGLDENHIKTSLVEAAAKLEDKNIKCLLSVNRAYEYIRDKVGEMGPMLAQMQYFNVDQYQNLLLSLNFPDNIAERNIFYAHMVRAAFQLSLLRDIINKGKSEDPAILFGLTTIKNPIVFSHITTSTALFLGHLGLDIPAGEMVDLSAQVRNPDYHSFLQKKLRGGVAESEMQDFLRTTNRVLAEKIQSKMEEDISLRPLMNRASKVVSIVVKGRVKSGWSTFKKVNKKRSEFKKPKIYDTVAFHISIRSPYKVDNKTAFDNAVLELIKKNPKIKDTAANVQKIISERKNPDEALKYLRDQEPRLSTLEEIVLELQKAYSLAFKIDNMLKTVADEEGWIEYDSEYDDYITNPKGNGYQAIQRSFSKVMERPETQGGKTSNIKMNFEIQIQTNGMNKVSTAGRASHVYYKVGEHGAHTNDLLAAFSKLKKEAMKRTYVFTYQRHGETGPEEVKGPVAIDNDARQNAVSGQIFLKATDPMDLFGNKRIIRLSNGIEEEISPLTILANSDLLRIEY